MGEPAATAVHTDVILGATPSTPSRRAYDIACSRCGRRYGWGYRYCPSCGPSTPLPDDIIKYNPAQPRDAFGRWTKGPQGLETIAAGTAPTSHGVGVSARFGGSASAGDPEARHNEIFDKRETYAPSPRAVAAREAFAAEHGAGPLPDDLTSIKADRVKAQIVADYYMDPNARGGKGDRATVAAYEDLVHETKLQMAAIEKAGVKVEYLTSAEIKARGLDPDGLNPYPTAKAQAADIESGRLMIASLAEYTSSHHPILDSSQGGAYDQFRAVHDFFGHAAVGTGFDRHGEYQAWVAHMSMFSGRGARAAASSELTAENSTLQQLPPGSAAPHRAILLPAHLIDPIIEDGKLVRKSLTCSCGTSFGAGYAKCPGCLTPVEDVEKGLGFATFGKFPRTGTLSSATRFTPDPRLHSHAFKPDPSRPSQCADCGMGTGAHSRMVYKPPVPEIPEEEGEPTTKMAGDGTMFTRLMRRAADLLIPSTPDLTLDPDDPAPIIKAAPKKRYSMAPVYMPNTLDAHGDFIATPDDLQTATWGYVEETAADRTVYLQHSPLPAGKWVEIMAWPYAVEATVTVPATVTKAATTKTVQLPAGTVYMGVIWEPWAYEEIEKGTLRGFSLGGTARRVEAVLDDPEPPPFP